MIGIYKITNKINNKTYIGQSTNITQRWSQEKSDSINPTKHAYYSILSQAFRKYGIENFIFEILEECAVSKLDERETYYINFYNSIAPNGYNAITDGQDRHNFLTPKAKEIQNKLLQHVATVSELSKEYNINISTISGINTGRLYHQDNLEYPLYKCPKEKIGTAKLNQEQVDNIIIMLQNTSIRVTELATMYNVSPQTIQRINKGETWNNKNLQYPLRNWKDPQITRTIIQYDLKEHELNRFVSAMDAQRQTGVNHSHIGDVCKGKRKTAGGYIWKWSS